MGPETRLGRMTNQLSKVQPQRSWGWGCSPRYNRIRVVYGDPNGTFFYKSRDSGSRSANYGYYDHYSGVHQQFETKEAMKAFLKDVKERLGKDNGPLGKILADAFKVFQENNGGTTPAGSTQAQAADSSKAGSYSSWSSVPIQADKNAGSASSSSSPADAAVADWRAALKDVVESTSRLAKASMRAADSQLKGSWDPLHENMIIPQTPQQQQTHQAQSSTANASSEQPVQQMVQVPADLLEKLMQMVKEKELKDAAGKTLSATPGKKDE